MHYDKTSITIHDIQMIDLSECLAIRKIVKQKVGKQKGGQQKGGQQKGGKQKVGQQDKQRVQDHLTWTEQLQYINSTVYIICLILVSQMFLLFVDFSAWRGSK